MLRNTLVALLILMVGRSYAQQDYFVLIQSENNQPFYVRLDDKTLSSTSKGHLILSQLKGGNHSIVIGWPRELYPEKQYSFDIDGKDLELQLKDQGDGGWGLYNPQTQELLDPGKRETATSIRIEGVKKDDAFSRLMAGVVSDTAVMYNTYTMEAALKDSPMVNSVPKDSPVVKSVQKVDSPTTSVTGIVSRPADTATVKIDSPAAVTAVNTITHDAAVSEHLVKTDTLSSHITAPPKTDSSAAAIPPRHIGTVVKLSERKTSKGLRLAFADRSKGRKADTIIVIIPMDSSLAVAKPADSSQRRQEVAEVHKTPDSSQPIQPVQSAVLPTSVTTSEKVATGTEQEYKSDTLHLYIGPKKGMAHNAPNDSSHAPALTQATPTDSSRAHTPAVVHSGATGELYRKLDSAKKKEPARLQMVNSDCHNFASDYDVDKLRVKMLEISKDDDKITTAKKIFKTKCFTTKQIRALSEVFTGDAAKYKFFETAYPFVSDDRFRDLTELLADPVYNGKFRAMTGQR